MQNFLGRILMVASLMAAPAAFGEEIYTGEDAAFEMEGTQQELPEGLEQLEQLDRDNAMPGNSAAAMFYGYRCDAWPVWGPGAYYWVHMNVYVARNNAIAACNRGTGMTCNWRCYGI